MKKITCILLLLSTTYITLLCQESANNKPLSTQAYFEMGISRMDVGALNTALYNLGLPQINQQVPNFSYGGSVLLNKLILGGQGTLYFIRNNYHPQILFQKNGGNGGIYGGYLLGRKNGRMLYPTLGIVYGGEMTHFLPRNSETILLEEKPYAESLQASGEYLSFPLNLNLDIFTGNAGKPGLMMGIRMGYAYRLALKSVEFTDINKNVLAVDERMAPHVFYVAVKIGIGTFKTY